MGSYDIRDKKPLEDHCGIIAAYASHDLAFFETGLKGLRILQTRGYDGAGFCALPAGREPCQYKGQGMVNEVFSASISKQYADLSSRIWVYQVRYGTNGNFSPDNVQPFIGQLTSTGDAFVVAHNGQFSQDLLHNEEQLSDTYLFTRTLANSSGSSWDERIVQTLLQSRGAWSLVVGTRDALYVARDPYGFRPLTYGHIWDDVTRQYVWVAASETSALEAMGASDVFELIPGSIAKVSEKGLSLLYKPQSHRKALCIFENIYIHHGAGRAHLPRNNPRTIRRSPTVDDVRRRSGKILAREAPLTHNEVDIIIGVPGTGIEGGMTYARSLDLPYFQAISDRATTLTEQRTFMTADIDIIYEKVLEHFYFDAQALKGRRVVLVDDSIVRGNITKGLIYLLKTHYDVPEVHIRILSPAIDKACHLGVNTRTNVELIAAQCRGDVEAIRRELGAGSLRYLSPEGLLEALTGNPHATGFCMGCMVGQQIPIDIYGNMLRQKRRMIGIRSGIKKQIRPPNYLFATP
jgi:amidophosphoribosyltransferase